MVVGHAEQVGDDEQGEGLGVLAEEFHFPSLTNWSIWRSANRHMHSFSFSRFGVSSRISNARCEVCLGGSIVTMCSLIGSWSRCASTIALMSSPSSGTGKTANGPTTELHDENVSVARDVRSLVVPGHREHALVGERRDGALRTEMLEIGVRVLVERRGP